MDDPLLWVALGSVILSAFFSLNSYALREASRRRLEAAFVGKPRERRESLLGHLRELHMLCGLLRSLGSLTLLLVVMQMFGFGAGRQTTWSLIGALAVAGGLVGLFVITIPHTWAHYSGPKILAASAGLLLALRKILLPVVALMRLLDVPIRRLSGVPDPQPETNGGNGDGQDAAAREEAVKAEILQVASEGEAEGAVDPEEMDMIESVIEFGDQQASEIMTPRTDVVGLPIDATPEEIWRTAIEVGHTRIPIYDGEIDNIIGVLYAKDLLGVDSHDAFDLRRIMRKPFFVPETKKLDELLREFKARKSHMAVIIDEYGGTAGLVTVEDLIEEIVGDIADEYDQPVSALMRRVDERTCEVDGRMYIDDLNDALELQLPEEEDYDTVAGFVSGELGFIPPVGEVLNAEGATFTVLAADDRKITRMRVELPAAENTEA